MLLLQVNRLCIVKNETSKNIQQLKGYLQNVITIQID